jgi:hypothetical protein
MRVAPGFFVLLLVTAALTGCRSQAPACAAYQQCLASDCPDCEPFADERLIGPLGDCWSGTPEEARNCEVGCLTALEDACAEVGASEVCCADPEHVYVP